MNYKWIGAVLVITACGGFGFSLAANHRRKEMMLLQMLRMLDYMECQLQYKLTPLPELCRMASREASSTLRQLFTIFAKELEQQVAPDAFSCMAAALAQVPSLGSQMRLICTELGRTLGIFDLPGQLKGLENVRNSCRKVLDSMECNREVRIKSYQTLGICAGVALVILFI